MPHAFTVIVPAADALLNSPSVMELSPFLSMRLKRGPAEDAALGAVVGADAGAAGALPAVGLLPHFVIASLFPQCMLKSAARAVHLALLVLPIVSMNQFKPVP